MPLRRALALLSGLLAALAALPPAVLAAPTPAPLVAPQPALQPVPGPGPVEQSVSRETLRDFWVLNGYYFTQTGGSPRADQGYSITDENGVLLWSEFQRLGGVDALGYPVSRRFTWDGFTVQATQKVVLQWRPEQGRAVFVNVLDEMTRAGEDDWLATQRLLPEPTAFAGEDGMTFDEIVAHREALLDDYPALRAAYFDAPDPLAENGLPVAPVTDVGPALVLRAQRRAFQLWKEATPFAQAGDVTVVNAGDLGKEAGLYPASATEPEPATGQVATPPGATLRVGPSEAAAIRQVVDRARPAVVELTDNLNGLGSGILYDASGLILTNSHVVTALESSRLVAVLPDGRTLPAKPLGYDDWTDVAVVKVDGANLPAVPLGTGRTLRQGERVIGIGYAPVLPAAPSAKVGVVRSLSDEIQTTNDYPLFNLISSDTYLHPGDSGGPLLDLSGQVVGINTAIRVARRGQTLTGFAIPVAGAQEVAAKLIASGGVPRPHLGVSVADVTPLLARQAGLSVNRGVLVREVTPDSPAAAAGVQAGDVIVGMDESEVASLDDLRRLMVKHQVGDTTRLALVSPGEPQRSVDVTLAERPTVKLALAPTGTGGGGDEALPQEVSL